MTVNLTRIYTRLGDDGETHLGDMSRVPKTHPRIEAYGETDELNAPGGHALGRRRDIPERYAEWLRRIQNDLFDLGADLTVPEGGEKPRRRVSPEQERPLARAGAATRSTRRSPRSTSFLLPGGSPAAAHLHVCRTVCRRAERRALEVEDANPEIRHYLNRLSDLLFILSRAANAATSPLGAGPMAREARAAHSRPPIAERQRAVDRPSRPAGIERPDRDGRFPGGP